MRRLLVSRDSRRRRRRRRKNPGDTEGNDADDRSLDAMPYAKASIQARREGDSEGGFPPTQKDPLERNVDSSSRSSNYYEDDEDEPRYEGWGSTGFSPDSSSRKSDGVTERRQWERVSGLPRPRRRPATQASSEREESRRTRKASRGISEREDGAGWGEGDVRNSRTFVDREKGGS